MNFNAIYIDFQENIQRESATSFSLKIATWYTIFTVITPPKFNFKLAFIVHLAHGFLKASNQCMDSWDNRRASETQIECQRHCLLRTCVLVSLYILLRIACSCVYVLLREMNRVMHALSNSNILLRLMHLLDIVCILYFVSHTFLCVYLACFQASFYVYIFAAVRHSFCFLEFLSCISHDCL